MTTIAFRDTRSLLCTEAIVNTLRLPFLLYGCSAWECSDPICMLVVPELLLRQKLLFLCHARDIAVQFGLNPQAWRLLDLCQTEADAAVSTDRRLVTLGSLLVFRDSKASGQRSAVLRGPRKFLGSSHRCCGAIMSRRILLFPQIRQNPPSLKVCRALC